MMAKGKSSFENMGAGLFGVPHEKEEVKVSEIDLMCEENPVTSPQKKTVPKKKVGKPKDDDLDEKEETIPTIVQLTKSTKYAIDKYALEKGYRSRSQAIRELIRSI